MKHLIDSGSDTSRLTAWLIGMLSKRHLGSFRHIHRSNGEMAAADM
jgi:hypothetical protein